MTNPQTFVCMMCPGDKRRCCNSAGAFVSQQHRSHGAMTFRRATTERKQRSWAVKDGLSSEALEVSEASSTVRVSKRSSVDDDFVPFSQRMVKTLRLRHGPRHFLETDLQGWCVQAEMAHHRYQDSSALCFASGFGWPK